MITETELQQFTGTEQYHHHWMRQFVFTDGVKYLADSAGAHWLIDVIASHNRTEPFQIWDLKVMPDKTAIVTMREDTDEPVKVRQEIPYTDFPLAEIKLFLMDGIMHQGKYYPVLLLTSEY